MGSADTDRLYMCIDLKCFYASVECADLGLDPFMTPLVVADGSRGKGAITLAISPALKKLGVKNRSRLFQIPPYIEYLTVKPHMKRYMQVSAEIYGTLLKYVAPEDVAVLVATKIYATVGIGTNLFLAKIALDILAKHASDFIGYLDESLFKETIWYHQPLTDIWQIGKGIANRLHKYGAYDLHGITMIPETKLYKEFGINAELIIDHAWGREPCTIADIHAYRPIKHSISHSQILLRNYTYEEAYVPMREMVESLVLELLQIKGVTNHIHVHIGYADEMMRSTGGSKKLKQYTDSLQVLTAAVIKLYEQHCRKNELIRRIGISFEDLVNRSAIPQEVDLFSTLTTNEEEKERQVQEAMLSIKKQFGKNSILRASSLQEEGTMRFRNTLVGGHNGE
ncbi:DNA repair protein [Veillonella parvula]|uniref:Y-family DNA polymerase n=1 Tax=Veillonella parvula TaxID=29466 RepID=UPI0028FE7709|nr:DNA repair protein [Veillonella parvula]MDU3191250.1 DNA repair protein [Veillonella parvula]